MVQKKAVFSITVQEFAQLVSRTKMLITVWQI